MHAAVPTTTVPVSTPAFVRWAGRLLSGLAVLFLLFDGVIKVMNIQPVIDASIQLGLPVGLAPVLGALLLVCTAIYLLPRTAVLGAILLTGYLGGAVAVQVRIEAGLFSLTLPLLLGALLWAGLYLRDARVRSLLLPTTARA